jgi:hypothetical protein
VIGAAAAATAAPDGTIDRERLRKAALLPPVGPNGWYYSLTTDGRVFAGGEEPEILGPAALRARMKGDDTDAERWMDVAAACRRTHDDAGAKESAAKAVAILRRRAEAGPGDGRPLATLGLALAAGGDDAGADAAVAEAAQAKDAAWAGTAASADLAVERAVARAAERRFATLDEARDWIGTDTARAALVDAAALGDAAKRYDDAVLGAEKSGASGPAVASVYLRRMALRTLRHARGKADAAATADVVNLNAADQSKALDALVPDPFALTLATLNDAMSPPDERDGSTHVLPFGDLADAARANVSRDLARLSKIAASADAPDAARALQGIACVQWFCMRNPAVAESVLRRSIAKDATVQSSWNALVFAMGQTRRWEELVKLCAEWIEVGETPRNRMMHAKALALAGHAEEAEKEWRAAQALEPSGFESNLGVAVLVLQRAKDDADVKEARKFLDAAAAALAASGAETYDVRAYARDLADAVARGLSGDADGAEKIARELLAKDGGAKPAKEILAALGR